MPVHEEQFQMHCVLSYYCHTKHTLHDCGNLSSIATWTQIALQDHPMVPTPSKRGRSLQEQEYSSDNASAGPPRRRQPAHNN